MWISRVRNEQLLARARELDEADPRGLALYGVPFAVKDNIDVAGMPTSAGCPGFAYQASATAPVVQRLLNAGAMLIGKTNMDQFATGLVGTRSPYGACSSVADPARVSGGSSSGSALAVALDLVAFALRHRYRRLGPGAGRVQRPGRVQAHARPAEHARRGARVREPGLRVDPHRRRGRRGDSS